MQKIYGIWGLGVVGKSVLQFLHKHAQKNHVHKLMVMDKRQPNQEEVAFLKKISIEYINQSELSEQHRFFESTDYIIPSPGIDTRSVDAYKHKMISEIDLFYDAWKKPLIAVTGTVGKTSIVHLLSSILEHNGVKLATGGNIGMGMLDLLDQDAECGLLELSSFQLEQAQRFAPDIAVLTNLYPNHLDRHGTMENYLNAKYHIMMHQKLHQKALIPWTLRNELRALTPHPFHFFSKTPLLSQDIVQLRAGDYVYVLHNKQLRKISQSSNELLLELSELPAVSYEENWVIIFAICDMLGILTKSTFTLPTLELPHHRMEKVGSTSGILFYNDSKSTIPESTAAALEHLAPARIHLLLGGLSKGVDRSKAIASFKGKVAAIVCFGAESETLYQACRTANIPAQKYANLEEAFNMCFKSAEPQDIILFSPAGSSYDLFTDYKERGFRFVQLVRALETK